MKALIRLLNLAMLGLFIGVAAADENQAAPGAKTKILEERVHDLKEKISRTKARILQMQESIASESTPAQTPVAESGASLVTGARAVVKHVNEMGDAVFKLISVQYLLDAQPIFQKADPGELAAAREIEVFNNNIGPGSHKLSVQMVFQGLPAWIFSYVKAYKFKVSSNCDFMAEQGKIVTVRVVGFDKGGWLSQFEDRPSIKVDVAVEDQGPTATPAN